MSKVTPPQKHPGAPQSEFATRKQLIDRRLAADGWKVVPFNEQKPLASLNRCAIEEYPTENGPADYALCADGHIVGIVEAKKLTLGPQNVLSQAERYAKGIHESGFAFGKFGVPFLYSTNGEVIWFHDIRHALNRSRQVTRFHAPGALHEQLARDTDAALVKLGEAPNNNPKLRPGVSGQTSNF